MIAANSGRKETVDIRKYPNRRFYDATHGHHLTLEDIRSLIKQGHDVRVTDSRTSADITGKVMTQIILDLDSPKLELFPAAFLAEVIRVNDHLLKGYFEKFLSDATRVFIDYQKLMESQIKDGKGLRGIFPPLGSWPHAMMNPFAFGHHTPSPPHAPQPGGSHPDQMSETLADMQRQMLELQARMAEYGRPAPRPARPGRDRAGAPARSPKKAPKK